MIQQLALVLDFLFLAVAVYLTGYNLMYLYGMKKTREYIGFSLPVMVQQAVRANVLLSVIAICLVGVAALMR